MKEYEAFQNDWDHRIQEIEQKNQMQLAQFQDQQTQELQQYRHELENKQFKFKASAEYLNNQKMQEVMVKQKQYGEAHKI